MVAGWMRLTFRLRRVRSLKDKRTVSARIRGRIRSAWEVAVAEVDALDDLRRLVLGVGMVGSDRRLLRRELQRIADHVEELGEAELVDRRLAVESVRVDAEWMGPGGDPDAG